MNEQQIVIDATNAVLGRLASFAAKQALLGKKIIIVNTADAIITGNKKAIIEDFNNKRKRGGIKGPFFPTHSHLILRRAIRNMLPYKKWRGDTALKNIKCFKGVPEQFSQVEKLKFAKGKKIKSMKVSEIEAK